MKNRWMGMWVALLMGTASSAWAEPYFAAWKGVNCNACHVNQTGGWMRNDYGKNYGNSLETFDWQGISQAADTIKHATPSWVDFGVDFHESYLATFNANPLFNTSSFINGGGSLWGYQAFSMRAKASNTISGVFTLRLDEINAGYPLKEFYGLISGLPEGGYVKIGKFTTPYGLSLVDDSSLVRLGISTVPDFPFSFDNQPQGGIEAGIYPDPFFINAAFLNSPLANFEKTVSVKGGVNFKEFTLGGSFCADGLDMVTKRMRYNAFGWTRLGPAVFLAEFDSGYDGVSPTTQNNYQAYHGSLEFDLGADIYLRLVSEWLDDSMKTNPSSGFRHVVSLRCYPVRNLKLQSDVSRTDSPSGVVNYAWLTDAYIFY